MAEKKAHSANNKNILRNLVKSATIVYGFYQLLNLSIFLGNHFRNQDLTEEQIKAMDLHNKHHHQTNLIDILGSGLGAGLNIVNSGASEQIKKMIEGNLAEENGALDQEVADLPPPLNHKHGSVDSTG
ncbi:MAG: hypothetical protein UR56_C0012G0006 [Candidatus Roizmanbacteria bacterium GW2011_GWC2_34_23]|uniref:Uncharacterized protein n=1 Tax=Candidatus Roizmanbacteria bacterium GW2011_GWC2_34_23 TaxID=1618484 RepID=A0A0G0AWS8_9BACT|nr:MAG: hypothetical protein UR56_C0012G0006 [Candidatus Roizmanbacteria bacterium GW2011_GWC2_34_23]